MAHAVAAPMAAQIAVSCERPRRMARTVEDSLPTCQNQRLRRNQISCATVTSPISPITYS